MNSLRWTRQGRHAVAASAVVAVLALAACGGGSSAGGTTGATGQATSGGTVYFAEGAQAAPNYIFPFAALQYFSTTNLNQFQMLMYRPLYWFGKGATPDLNLPLSLANAPKYSDGGKTITVTMKPYKWSNGETVTAQDVVFWMNMMKVEKLNWAGYAAGTIPDDLASVTASGNTVTFTLNTNANSNWYTYNELSQITPMPMAWDISAAGQKSGSEACGTASFQDVTVTSTSSTVTPVSAAAKSCAAVYTYLTGQAKKLSSYATSPLWAVVDGPWKLTHFDTSGNVTMVPNPKYSGPVKPKLAKFVELPFTSDSAEFNALAAGKVDVGYVPPQDISSNATTTGTCGIKPGANNPRLANYNIVAGSTWQINYFPENFNSTGNGGNAGKIFDQLYFRQAFQMLVNQPVYIQHIFKGYGVPTYGPVPVCPQNSFASSELSLGNPYAYNPTKAKALLKANGWTVKPGGTDTCNDASKCGVPAGTPLDLDLQYVSGSVSEDQLMQAEKSSWAQAGIHVNMTTGTFDTVLGNAVPCGSSSSNCSWQMANWGGGWIFAPDYYPSGEDLFQTGAGSNSGSYSDKTMDSLIDATTKGNSSLSQYEVYGAKQLPVIWQPIGLTATEINKKLAGVTPLNPLTNINPETWYFTK
ncbi:MAG TPA: ABC transporter substrate-binding protein [Gaiellaceae bacterium]|nr:ABC transporter substrate-binding protein [Gaiellaceae bacterium]